MSAPVVRTWEEADRIITAPGSRWELVEQVIDGRPMQVWKNSPNNFREFLIKCMEEHKGKVMLSSPIPEPADYYAREHVTFDQVHDKSLRLAAWLRENGVRQGGRVVVGGANSTGWVVAFTAIHLLGAVPVFLNSTLVIDNQVHCLAVSKPQYVFVDSQLAQMLAPRADELKAKGVGPIYCWSGVSHLDATTRKNIRELGDPRPSPARVQEVIDGVDIHNLGPESDGTIFFTSGTTSKPKAVLSTQRAAIHSVLSAQVATIRNHIRRGKNMEDIKEGPPSAILLAIPMFHVTGCLSWLLRFFRTGSKAVFMRRWNVADAIKLIQDEDIKIIGGVPAIVTAIYQSPLLPKGQNFASMSYGGAPSTERMPGDLKKRFPGIILNHGYGMTETNAVHSAIAGDDYIDKPGSVGRAVPGCAVRITHPETRKEVPPHTMGIIEMKGYTIMKCYLDDPAATAAALTPDGWLNSGDMGMVDEEGCLYLRDRAKDIIIRGGENIASAEVENAIAEDDRIAEVAAVPVPCPLMGERVGVAVSLAPGASATEEEIMKTVEPRLRSPARPVIVWVSPEPLPRNANGKILKTDVKVIVQDIWKKENRAAKYAKREPVRAKL